MGNVIINGVSYTSAEAAKIKKPKKKPVTVEKPKEVVKKSDKPEEKSKGESDN